MTSESKTEMLTIRIDKKTKEILKSMADADRRSLSDYIRLQLERLAEQKKK